MATRHPGGCFCGATRYLLTEDPLTLYACHCTDCQRQTGTSFALSMVVRKAALQLLCGDPRHYEMALPDGRRKHGRFCGECGTRLWGEPRKFPQVIILRPGTLDDTSWLHPIAHIWTRSAQPWVAIPKDTLNFETQPEDPMALVNAWRDRQSK